MKDLSISEEVLRFKRRKQWWGSEKTVKKKTKRS